jgi:transglutaminase-like putative cysteine protease
LQKIRIQHNTTYHYTEYVKFGLHTLLLRPRVGHDIRIESSRLDISADNKTTWFRDSQNNSIALVEILEASDRLCIASEVVIEHHDEEVRDVMYEHAWAKRYPFQYAVDERAELSPYMMPIFTKGSGVMENWLNQFWQPGWVNNLLELLDAINQTINNTISYQSRETFGVQRPVETIESGSGSCRDLATLFLEACRHLGLAARFVSGYLYAPGLAASERSTHAWAEVYIPGLGWLGYDSTTGKTVAGDHIAVAVARHPERVPPVAGSFEGNAVANMSVEVNLEPC